MRMFNWLLGLLALATAIEIIEVVHQLRLIG